MKIPKDDASKKALEVEKRMLLSLSHPNVIKAVPCELPAYRDNLVMEKMYCDLHHYINQRARAGSSIPEKVLRSVMGEVLSGLKYIHSHGIAHRDIKPENILLGTRSHEVVICDFGTALQFGSNTRDFSICGTALYQAPEMLELEQVRKGRVGALVAAPDMFSLGVSMLVSHTASLPPHQSEHTQEKRVELMLNQCRVAAPVAFDDEASTSSSDDECSEASVPSRPASPAAKPAGTPMSDEAFAVIQGLLAVNPEERLTAASALKMPWFTQG
eukprot:TRINITY_DN29459_c0_g2_i1.p1 TRINITY_DN29459_c0_g2~~TRINITY_DN29459_c0_g2_i1.p1  ORF type:complete len:272 (+),score=125.45 TRINITY_DN29459_c0_g2_i1:364-1179(+)